MAATDNRMDPSTAIGIFTAIALMVVAIAVGENGISAFIDLPSLLIVVGGTLAITTASFTLREMLRAQRLVFQTIFYPQTKADDAAMQMLELAEVARREGILKLQAFQEEISESPFLRKGIDMIVDGVEPSQVETILYQDINSVAERHHRGVSILRRSAEVAPAMGLIGTLIGLVQMLGSLDDPSNIGPAMATALLTTLYGATLAYVVFTPLASKLERNTNEEIVMKRLYAQGVLSIGKQENPRRLEMLFNTILPPEKRVRYFS